ncbi:MAG: hypothetical protein IPG67_02715 [Acidobacteria bacterium]|nr:hypothetical protein [Acidobacteriota bacterium]
MIKTKVLTFLTVAAFVLNLSGLALADTRRTKKKVRQSNALVSMLPASDGVATFDVKRFFNDAMPKVLSANQPMIAKIMSHISQIESKTGIDLRKFEQVAAGINMKIGTANKLSADPVVIARGSFSSDALISTAKTAAEGKFREEKFGDRNVIIFAAKDEVKKNVPTASVPVSSDVVNSVIDGMPNEIAVTSLDSTTLVIGSPERVRQTLDRTTSVALEISSLLSNSETAVCTFAMRVPDRMASIVDLDKDELGENINSIKYLSGSMSVNTSGAVVSMMARTARADQAKALYDTLSGLKMIGEGFLGGSKKAEHKVMARMLKATTVTNRGNDISLVITVPQEEINMLVATIK